MKILIVDDSIIFRNILTNVVKLYNPNFEVMSAINGLEGIATFKEKGADIIILDIEMPKMDGVEAVKQIRLLDKSVPIIMFTTIAERYAKKVMDAFTNGATEYLTKGSLDSIEENIALIKETLIPIIISKRRIDEKPKKINNTIIKDLVKDAEVLAIGSSTGGPEVLRKILKSVNVSHQKTIFIIQHMPEFFTKQFAISLNSRSQWEVKEASDGEIVQKGTIYIAPGNRHMVIINRKNEKIISITDEEKHNFLRPSVDITLNSLSKAYKTKICALILTGMGSDGTQGCMEVLAHGGTVAVQDQASSLIWGMPESTLKSKVTDITLSVEEIILLINSL